MACFFDTNILIYALEEGAKGKAARRLLDEGGRVSVQCLNEFANVARRKLGLDWDEIEEAVSRTRQDCGPVIALGERIHVEGLRLARRYQLSIYDSMMAAAALSAGCTALYSEDMQDGLVIDGRPTVVNPFAAR